MNAEHNFLSACAPKNLKVLSTFYKQKYIETSILDFAFYIPVKLLNKYLRR